MKRKTIVAGIILILVIIGGVFMFEHKQLEVEKFRREQDRMALYLVNHYEGVKKIEFGEFVKNESTGNFYNEAVVNTEYKVSFTLWGFGGEITVSQLGEEDKYLEKKKEMTNDNDIGKVDIIYGEDNQW